MSEEANHSQSVGLKGCGAVCKKKIEVEEKKIKNYICCQTVKKKKKKPEFIRHLFRFYQTKMDDLGE